MSDSPFDPSGEAPSFKGLPIVEDTDDRKVIVLSPRDSSEIGLGCGACLFIPAALLCLPVIFPAGQVESPWLLGTLLLLAVVIPVLLIGWSRTTSPSEETVILESNRITRRRSSFDRRTGDLKDHHDEVIEIGLGSGLTERREDDDHRTLVIWGSAASLNIQMDSAKFPWLRQHVHEWLERKVFSNRDMTVLERSSNRASPLGTLLTLSEVNHETLHGHIAAGGPKAAALGRTSFSSVLFVTVFGALWHWLVPVFDWMPIVILGVMWLVSVVVFCVWIRKRFEIVELHVTPNQLIVTRTSFGWRSHQEIELGTSPSVRLEVSLWHGLTPIPKLCVSGSYEDARFGTMLGDDEKRWLVLRLRAFLKLDPRTNIFAEPKC